MDKELGRELMGFNRDIATLVMAHSFLLYALLSVTDPSSLRRVREVLESHAASDEYQGVPAAALRDAQRIFSALCDSEGPVDPRKLFRLIPGGKE